MYVLMRFQVLRGLQLAWPTYRSLHHHPKHCLARPFSRTKTLQWANYEIPKEFNFASDVIDHWARMEKEGKRDPLPALWWVNDKGDEVKWNFRELSDLTNQTANVLTDTCGLQRGDRVLLILPRIPELWLLTVGCMRAGLVFIPGTTQLTAKDILYRLQSSKSKAIVVNETLAPVVDSIMSDCPLLKTKLLVSENSRDGWLDFKTLLKAASVNYTCVRTKIQEPMTIFFTSGTTGLPKMVLHTTGLAMRSCLPSTYKFPTLKHSVCGGEVLLPEDFEKWKRATGVAIHEIFGQSETGITCAVSRGMKIKKGSMGKVIPPYDMQIIDEKGNILPPGIEGEIAIRIKPTRPIGLFSGYLDNSEKTSLPERGDFYLTGDRGHVDEDGYFWFLGRSDDIINASGYRIGPSEIENALAEHPAVAESAVIGSPDPVRGEVVKAFVVLTPEFRSHDHNQLSLELQQHVKNVTAPYKYPRKVEFVLELPKTTAGKIKRNELRKYEK